MLKDPPHRVIDTARHTWGDLFSFVLSCAWLILKVLLSRRSTSLVLHGAYSPTLWPLLFFRRVIAVSILQGSEVNIDFKGVRAYITTIILRNSALVVCRNEAQRDLAIRLCGVNPAKSVVVNWGLKQELFNYNRPIVRANPVLISPRATQPEYNIPLIFEVVARLKKEGCPLHFVYVRFNPTFVLNDTTVADEVLDAPSQQLLWEKMAAADLCISVPNYDGLSNTIVEALALGSMPIFSDLAPYEFLKRDTRLGISVKIEESAHQNAEQLYTALRHAIACIEKIRLESAYRRQYAEKNFKAGTGAEYMVEVLCARR